MISDMFAFLIMIACLVLLVLSVANDKAGNKKTFLLCLSTIIFVEFLVVSDMVKKIVEFLS